MVYGNIGFLLNLFLVGKTVPPPDDIEAVKVE
jgi:hypothetical protein